MIYRVSLEHNCRNGQSAFIDLVTTCLVTSLHSECIISDGNPEIAIKNSPDS